MLQVVAMNSHENKAPGAVNEAAVVGSSEERMEKVSVDTTAEEEISPAMTAQHEKDRMSWQYTCWDDMYEINTNTTSGRSPWSWWQAKIIQKWPVKQLT